MSWPDIEFKDFVILQRGFDLPVSKMKEGDVPVLGSNCIVGYHNEPKVDPPGVVTGRSGTLGLVQYTESSYWPHNTALWVKDFKGNYPKFVYYKLQTLHLERFNGGASVPTLNRNVLDTLKLKIPKYDVQRKIASILSAYDDLIENNNRRIKLLEESARLLYQEWFVSLRFPGYEHTRIVDGVPEGWEKVAAFDAMEVLSGGTPKTVVPEYWGGDIPFYTPKDAVKTSYVIETEKNLTEVGLKNCNSKLYPKDTVFITARGTVGNLNLAQRPMAMNQSCYALQGKGTVSQLFLYCAMREGIDYLKQHAVGAVFDAIIVNTFKLIPFLVPEDRFIRDFEESADPVFHQVENLLMQNQKLKAARDLLLLRLMSGEIAV